jgi:hypothetical protein
MRKYFKDFLFGLIVGLIFFLFFGILRGGIPGVDIFLNLIPNNFLGLFLVGLPYVVIAMVAFYIVLLIRKSCEKILLRSINFGVGVYIAYLPVVWVFLKAISNFQIL